MDVYYGAPGFHYLVNYRTEDQAAATQVVIKDLNQTEFEIPTPGLYKKYFISVQSANDLGKGPKPEEKPAFSGTNRKCAYFIHKADTFKITELMNVVLC